MILRKCISFDYEDEDDDEDDLSKIELLRVLGSEFRVPIGSVFRLDKAFCQRRIRIQASDLLGIEHPASTPLNYEL